jgi:hypothetical protein
MRAISHTPSVDEAILQLQSLTDGTEKFIGSNVEKLRELQDRMSSMVARSRQNRREAFRLESIPPQQELKVGGT